MMTWNQANAKALTYAETNPLIPTAADARDFASDYADVWAGSPRPQTVAQFAHECGLGVAA